MHNFYSWSSFTTPQIIFALVTILIIVGFHIWITVIDFKYKSIKYWKILLTVMINFIAPIPYCLVYGSGCLILPLVIGFIIWFVFSVIQSFINKETIIGQADIDILISQVILSGCMCFWFFEKLKSEIALIITMTMIKDLLTALLIGMIIMLIIWAFKAIYNKISKKEFVDSKNIPNLLSFIPAVILNLLVMMAL